MNSDIEQLIDQASRRLNRFDDPLRQGGSDDPEQLYQPLDKHRENDGGKMLWFLGLRGNVNDQELRVVKDRLYILYGGHRGCGKSTELRRLQRQLHDPKRFYVLFIDAEVELSIHNLRYIDVLLSVAKKLFEQLERDQIEVDKVFLEQIEEWFDTRILQHIKHFGAHLRVDAGAETRAGVPGLARLFGKLVAQISAGSDYREEIRREVQSSYGELVRAFNNLLVHAEQRIAQKNLGRKLLFIIDGTDKLNQEDAQRLFVDDIHQLQAVSGYFICCAHLLFLNTSPRSDFLSYRLPMVKLGSKGAEYDPQTPAAQALRTLSLKRVDGKLFSDQHALDELVAASGGHLRDLISLLAEALAEAQGVIAIDHAQRAVKRLSTAYRRLLQSGDLDLLAEIDANDEEYTPADERSSRLLYHQLLLEYDSYWWQSHPVVRILEDYHNPSESFYASGVAARARA